MKYQGTKAASLVHWSLPALPQRLKHSYIVIPVWLRRIIIIVWRNITLLVKENITNQHIYISTTPAKNNELVTANDLDSLGHLFIVILFTIYCLLFTVFIVSATSSSLASPI
jgi:hypothetical protein